MAAYVWDYAGEMQLMRRFWDAAVALDPAARTWTRARASRSAGPRPLARAVRRGRAARTSTARAIDVPTVFRDFDDYWGPFLGGQGPAPGYAHVAAPARPAALREPAARRAADRRPTAPSR